MSSCRGSTSVLVPPLKPKSATHGLSWSTTGSWCQVQQGQSTSACFFKPSCKGKLLADHDCIRYNYKTGEISPKVEEQAEQTLINVDAALEEAGSCMADVVRVQYILPDRKDFPQTWPVLQKWFGNVRPSAMMIQSELMKEEMKIEIEVTAKKGCGKK